MQRCQMPSLRTNVGMSSFIAIERLQSRGQAASASSATESLIHLRKPKHLLLFGTLWCMYTRRD